MWRLCLCSIYLHARFLGTIMKILISSFFFLPAMLSDELCFGGGRDLLRFSIYQGFEADFLCTLFIYALWTYVLSAHPSLGLHVFCLSFR